MSDTKGNITVRILSTVSFAVMVTVNALANIIPINLLLLASLLQLQQCLGIKT